MVDKNTQATERDQEAADAAPQRERCGCHFRPDVDVLELPDELVIQADIPGATPEGIDIDLKEGTLSVRAKVEPRERIAARRLLREYGVGDYYRTFRVGEGINTEEIAADYTDGLLTLRLPKLESAKPRKIAVRAE